MAPREHATPPNNAYEIALEPWGVDDLPLLTALLGDPAMTAHLGGPESPDQLATRQERYVRLTETGAARMFKISASATREPVGSVGFWQRTWHDEPVYEIGWSVLIPFQGRGIAARATALALDQARAGDRRFLHPFPGSDNPPSNALCRKLGFTLREECTFEYPVGSFMRCNDWCLDLHPDRAAAR